MKHEFQNWLKQRRIVLELTTAYSLESNGSAEGLNRILMDMERTMFLYASHFRNCFCDEAMNTASFISNRLVTKSCTLRCTPFDVFHGGDPDVGFFRLFGNKAFGHKSKKKWKVSSTVEHWKAYWWDIVKEMHIVYRFQMARRLWSRKMSVLLKNHPQSLL